MNKYTIKQHLRPAQKLANKDLTLVHQASTVTVYIFTHGVSALCHDFRRVSSASSTK